MSTPNAEGERRPVQAEDVQVTLAVRRDLGADNDQAVIGEFLDRVGSAIDERVDARVRAHTAGARQPADTGRPPSNGLGFVSVLAGIPITAVATGPSHSVAVQIIAVVASWAAIAAINVAYARRRR